MKKIYLFAVIFALIAGVCTYFFVTNLSNQAANGGIGTGESSSTVVVAIQDIEKNTPVTADMFKEVTLPNSSITYGTAVRISDLTGYIATDNIYKGEQVLVSKLALMGKDSESDRLSYNMADGYYAFSITVDDQNSIGYFIREGDFVDIYGYGTSATWSLLMENIEVLRIGTYSDAVQESQGVDTTTYTLLTVAVTKEQADLLQNGNAESGEIQKYRITLVPYPEAADITTTEPESETDAEGNTIEFEPVFEPQTNYGMGDISVETTVEETTAS